jgi:uncharacterized protein (TIGR02996 family)
MAVYLVYRCWYIAPGERAVRRFAFDTVLDWFRSIWTPIPDEGESHRHARDLLDGLDIGLFAGLFQTIAEQGTALPETLDEVLPGFDRSYMEESETGPHHIQLIFEEDDNQMGVYLFDDHFRAENPGLTDFLLLEGSELPAVPDAEPDCLVGNHSGFVYDVALYTDNKYNLEDLSPALQIQGIRVPDLCRYHLTRADEKDLDHGQHSIRRRLLELLAAPGGEDAGFLTALRDHPDEEVHWAVYSDWLLEHGRPPAGLHLLETALRTATFGGAGESRDPSLDLVKVTPHLAQACKHEMRFTIHSPGRSIVRDVYTQWIFFDDCWAAAHPSLADGLLRFAARWDVLTPESAEDE